MTFSGTQLPRPDNWQDFERNTKTLFIRVLNDPATQCNGRTGQKQHGVDVYGRRDGKHWVGVQCKQKLNAAVTEDELRKEVKNAKEFIPSIKEFILVTTAPRDQSIQEVARRVQEEIKDDPVSFTVSVWGWEDICEQVNMFDDVRRVFDPTWSSSAQKTLEQTESIANTLDNQHLEINNKLDLIISAQGTKSDETDTALIGQIKVHHSQQANGDSRSALKSLNELRSQNWDDATPIERYHLLVAIGSCYIGLGQNQLAGESLKEAHGVCPSHEKAKSNLATAHLLHYEEATAQQLALDILGEDPGDAHAATILIQSRAEGDIKNLLDGVPEPLLSDVSIVVAQISAHRMRNDSIWKSMARDAYHKFKGELKEYDHLPWLFAEAIVDTLFSGAQSLQSGKLSGISISERDEALEILVTRAKHALTQGATLAPTLLNNACVGLRLVEKLDDAEKLATQACEKYPEDKSLMLQRALIGMQREDFAAVLKALPDSAEDPQLVSIRSAAMYESGDIQGALSLLSATDFSGEPFDVQSVAIEIEFKANRALYGNEEASKLISKLDVLISEHPTRLRFQNLRVRFLRLLGNEGEAISQVELLSKKHTSETDPVDRAETSFEAELLSRYDIVVQLLYGHVLLNEETPQLRTLIGALFETSNYTLLHGLLNSLGSELTHSHLYLRSAAKLAVDSGAPDAEQKIANYIEVEPNDAIVLITQIAIWQSNNNPKQIADSLRSIDFKALEGDAESRMRLCLIASNYGRVNDAVVEGHQILMMNWDNPTIHKQYATLILMADKPGADLFTDCSQVAIGTAVSVVSDSVTTHYRIEEKSDSAFTNEQISPDSKMGAALLGKKIGESFSIGEGIRKRNYKIESIKPIPIDSLHRSFRVMDHRFPTFEGHMMLSVNPESEDGLSDIRELMLEQNKYHDSILALYEKSGLSLTVCAAKSGLDALEYRERLFMAGVPIRVCTGTEIELKLALSSIRRNMEAGCVVDALTAHFIYSLKLQSYIESVCGPIHIAQSTLDTFASRSLHFDHRDRCAQGRLLLHDGEPTLVEIDEAQLNQVSDLRKQEWAWARNKTVLTAVIPDSDIPNELRELETIIGARVFDSAIISKSNNILLVSEDKELREISTGLIKTRGTWLQPVLDIALSRGQMPKDRYCEAIIDIALSGVSFSAINADCLYFQAGRDKYEISTNFQTLLNFLGTPDALISRSVKIAGDFLKKLWSLPIPLSAKCRYASAIFETLTRHRNENRVLIINEILESSSTYEYGIPDLNTHAHNWHMGHSMGF